MAKQTYWFRPKKYGLGWMPISWQGWLATICFAFLYGGGIITFYHNVLAHPQNALFLTTVFIIYAVAITAYFLKICSAKGKKTR